MFGIGTWEMVLCGVVVILVYGPERLPQFAYKAGKFIREFKQISDAITIAIRREMNNLEQTAREQEEAKLKMERDKRLGQSEILHQAPMAELSSLKVEGARPSQSIQTENAVETSADVHSLHTNETVHHGAPSDQDAVALEDTTEKTMEYQFGKEVKADDLVIRQHATTDKDEDKQS